MQMGRSSGGSVGRRTNTSWSSSQSATAFAREASPKSKATKLAELGRLSTPTYTAFTLKAQNQNAIRVSSSQDVGSCLLWSWLTVGLVVVQGVSRRQLSGVAYGLSYQ